MHIGLKNTKNTRSLSDLINKNGCHIKNHLLIRSDALHKINEEDIYILKEEYHLKRVIDLRCDNESKNNPDVQIEGVKVILNPILPSERVGVTKKGNDEKDFLDFIDAIQKSGASSSVSFMKKVYQEIVSSEFSCKAYHQFIKILLEPIDGASLWHCSAGKDRAGFATILVLYLLDFDVDLIKKDYLSTNLFYQESIDQYSLKYGEEYRDVLTTVFGVREEYLDVLFENINQQYGSMDQYIEKALKISLKDKKKLQELYLEEI